MTGMGFRGIDWTQVAHDISGRGYAKLPKLIDSNLCSSHKNHMKMNNYFGIAL